MNGICGTLRLARVMRMHEARSVVSAKGLGQNSSDDLGGCHAPVEEQALGVVRRDERSGRWEVTAAGWPSASRLQPLGTLQCVNPE